VLTGVDMAVGRGPKKLGGTLGVGGVVCGGGRRNKYVGGGGKNEKGLCKEEE